ncbi:MAG TPA: ATPase domain-containing protein, partial [Candidatus Dormibacteraeota bacterium]|nr:ATPase domain-containing protein [Candidatus Dormibacteraeota bacterium]
MSQAVQRLRTGRDDIDLILGGGLMPGSTIVVAGPPGSGKTVFAHQICFSNATVDRPALYYTTWSEPHTKLFRNLSQFAFFDEQAIGERLDVLHLPAIVGERGAFQEVADELLRATVQRRPSIVVIDSSKALHGLVPEGQLRRMFYELASRVGQTESVLLLVGEYTPDEIEESPEFAVADGIVQLGNEPRGLDDRRWIRVLKMRGSANLPGRHSVSIDQTGFNAFPRLELLVPETVAAEEGRASLGDAGLDEITHGGLPRGDATMLLGPSGVGKTVLALSFIADGVRRGDAGLYLSFQETPAELVAKADKLG